MQMPVRSPKPPRRWKLQTAKARFSEVYRLARSEGPQLITSDGNEGVIVLPAEQFAWLASRSRQPKSLVQFFRESPLAGMGLDFDRSLDTAHDVDL